MPCPEEQASPNDRDTLKYILTNAEGWVKRVVLYGSTENRRLGIVMNLRAAEALADTSGRISARTWRRLRDLRRMVTGESE